MNPRPLTFTGSGGEPVAAMLHPGASPRAPYVVVCHGFKGFKDWGFFPEIARRVAVAGFNALRIDYSHNGCREGEFDRLDLFERDTWTRHQEDLLGVIEGCGADVLGILGHSRGGVDGILAAGGDARVRAVCALAPPATTRFTPPDLEAQVKALGHYPVLNTRTQQVLPVGRDFFVDAERHDVLDSAHKMSDRPVQVIVGDQDEAVSVEDARKIARAHGDGELVVVKGAGHTFGIKHPWAGTTPHFEEAMAAAIDFLTRCVV